jgi:hypothetical protein
MNDVIKDLCRCSPMSDEIIQITLNVDNENCQSFTRMMNLIFYFKTLAIARSFDKEIEDDDGR